MTEKQTKNYVKSSFYPWFIHILSYRFTPIRSQLETVLDFWFVSVCMKECELIKGLLASSPNIDQHQFFLDNINTSLREKVMGIKKKKDKQRKNVLIFYQILLTNSCVWAKALSNWPNMVSGHLASKPSCHQWNHHQE